MRIHSRLTGCDATKLVSTSVPVVQGDRDEGKERERKKDIEV